MKKKSNPIVIAEPSVYVPKYLGSFGEPKTNVYQSKHLNIKRRGLNPHYSFNDENYKSGSEQELVKSLIEEQIQIYGYKGTYILKTAETVDRLYGEYIGAHFKYSFPIEFMPENNPEAVTHGYGIELYGFSQLDTFSLNVAYDRMNDEIERLNIPDRKYPMIGDLIRYDMQGKLFEVKYVEEDYVQFTKGTKTIYKLECQLFNLGQETFDTGDKEIDYLNHFEHTHEYPVVNNDIIRDESQEITIPEPNIWDLNLQNNVEFDKEPEPKHKRIIKRTDANIQRKTNKSEPNMNWHEDDLPKRNIPKAKRIK